MLARAFVVGVLLLALPTDERLLAPRHRTQSLVLIVPERHAEFANAKLRVTPVLIVMALVVNGAEAEHAHEVQEQIDAFVFAPLEPGVLRLDLIVAMVDANIVRVSFHLNLAKF